MSSNASKLPNVYQENIMLDPSKFSGASPLLFAGVCLSLHLALLLKIVISKLLLGYTGRAVPKRSS